jgi:hypothetical protein
MNLDRASKAAARKLFKADARGDYDPITDTVSGKDTTPPTISALMTSFKEKDVDGLNVQPSDVRCTILASDLTSRQLPVPKVQSEIQRADGTRWITKNVKDTLGVLYILQIRKA